jgi:protein SCO1/2
VARAKPLPSAASALTALLLTLALAACGGGPDRTTVVGEADTDGYAGTALDQPYEVAGDRLTDTEGAAYSLTGSTDAPVTLVFFGYTNCPDICQMVMSTLAAAKLRLPEADREKVDVVFVTTDPARDDAGTLRAYLDRFDPSFVGLTGKLPTIVRVADSVAVFLQKGERLPSGGYDVEHNDHVVAVTGDDRVPLLWLRDASAAEVATDLERLLRREEGA